MDYIRLCKDLADKGTLIPVIDNDFTGIYKLLNKNKDAYTSIFYFNDKHYEDFKKTGSVAGITDVTTDKLTFDFDSENNVEEARVDAVEIVKRLQSQGYTEENIRIFFSGNKGFEVSVQLDGERLTPAETKNICMNLADGLPTVDSKIYNATRIFRLPLTKHQKSGLYKYPLGVDDLKNLSAKEIAEVAKQELDYSAIKDAWKPVKLTALMKDLKSKTPVVKPLTAPVAINVNDVDWTKKPTDLSPAKWLLELGFFPAGSRSHAGMILASTYRNLGYDEAKAYYLIKSAMEKQSVLMGCDKFSKGEIWNNIIRQVYSPSWNGGTYSEKSDELLLSLAASIPARHVVKSKEDVISVEQVGHIFEDYAKNIGKNRLECGIKSLDAALEMQVGRVYAIGGSPGSGKCHGINTPIMMFDGTIKMVQDVKVGDLLMGDDSTPRTVLGLARGQEMLYNVKQSNGDDYVVNESHILSLKHNISDQIIDMKLTDYLAIPESNRELLEGYKAVVYLNTAFSNMDRITNFKKLANDRGFGCYIVQTGNSIAIYYKIWKSEIEIEKLEVGDYYGFEIDGNHRYLLGDFTVTHNTSLALQMLNNTSKQSVNSMFFSFDMSLEDVYQKLIQKHYRISAKEVYVKMEDAEWREKFRQCLAENYSNVNFVRSAGMSIEEMKDRIIRTEQALGTDIKYILVDYLDLIRSDYSDPTQRSMYSVQGLKEIATALRKCVVFLGQPNKANQRMDEPAETYAAFKGSGALAELSNAMLWINRPGANPRTFENDKFYSIDCLKNRHGAMFSLDFAWDGITGSIRELEAVEKMNLEELRVAKANKKKDNDNLF